MGQTWSSTMCLGDANDVVHSQNRSSRFGGKKNQKKRGVVNGNATSECADPKMYNLMAQSILQQQLLRQQQQQQQFQTQPLPTPVSNSTSKQQAMSSSSSPSAANLGGQGHLLYRKHPKSILAIKGTGSSSSSSAAQQSQNASTLSSPILAPWGTVPRRNVPTKLIVRRPRRGTFPLSFQDEGLSGTQIYTMRYWVQKSSGSSGKENDAHDHYNTSASSSRNGQFEEEASERFHDKEEDQDCVWMMMQDDDDEGDDNDELIQDRRRLRQQEQYPGRRKKGGANLTAASATAASGALPTLLPLYHAKSGGNVGYSTNLPSYAFRDLERKRQPSTPLTTAAAATTSGNAMAVGIMDPATLDGSSNGVATPSATASLHDNTSNNSNASRTTSAMATSSSLSSSSPSVPPPPAWPMPSPSSAMSASATLPNGDFFTPHALAMRQPRQVVDWITISEEYNIHVADVGLTPAECDHLVQVTEQVCRGQYAAYTYAKQTLGCREYPILAQACVDPVHSVVEAIRTYTALHPHNSSAYFGCNNLQLDDREPHMVKYDVTKKERQKLDMHTDKSEWTFLIALSNGCGVDYDGGGTFFECLDATIHVQRGHALIFPGKLRHCGQRITTGLRFILVGFLVDKPMLPLNGPSAAPSNLPAANAARCSGPMAIPPDHHRA